MASVRSAERKRIEEGLHSWPCLSLGSLSFGRLPFGRALSIRGWLARAIRRISTDAPERGQATSLARSYATALANRLPLIYAVLVVGMWVLSARFIANAPLWLTVIMPLLMSTLAIWRAIYWLPVFVSRRTDSQVQHDLARMTTFGGYAALMSVIWSLLLYPYGDQAQQSLIQYVSAISCYTAILGLGQSPRTAANVALAGMVPSTLFHIFQHHPNAMAVAVVQLVVTILLLAVTNGYHRDFLRLELSRKNIARREREAARLAEANRKFATLDPLTGSFNRRALLARLEQELATDSHQPVWLALLDLDGFKHINDTYGHAAGDTVLKAVSDRIGQLPSIRAYGRIGGDEFAILLDAALDEMSARSALQGLSETIRQPISHNGVSLRLAGSIGFRRAECSTVSECLERSDAALYKAKEKGDGAVVLFTAADEIELRRRNAVTRRFNDCLLDERLQLVYQPMVDVETGQVRGHEAFARWSPDGVTWLGPDQFLPLAQATGRTGELTRLVLARALEEAKAAGADHELSINLSPRDVMRDGTAQALSAIVVDAGFSPHRLVLEITERSLQHDPKRAAVQLERLRELGFRIALDDFGTGWSSLSNVRMLPLDRIKIDRGLATALADDPGARGIAGTIVGLAWQMGLECSIEGIESDGQLEMARALGLRLMQGYYLGRPLPACEIPEFLGPLRFPQALPAASNAARI